MDDFGLTMDDLVTMDSLSQENGVLSNAENATMATMAKLERLGMMVHDWHTTLVPAAAAVPENFDPNGAW